MDACFYFGMNLLCAKQYFSVWNGFTVIVCHIFGGKCRLVVHSITVIQYYLLPFSKQTIKQRLCTVTINNIANTTCQPDKTLNSSSSLIAQQVGMMDWIRVDSCSLLLGTIFTVTRNKLYNLILKENCFNLCITIEKQHSFVMWVFTNWKKTLVFK